MAEKNFKDAGDSKIEPAVVKKDASEKKTKRIRVVAKEIQHRGLIFIKDQTIEIDESSANFHIKHGSAVAV